MARELQGKVAAVTGGAADRQRVGAGSDWGARFGVNRWLRGGSLCGSRVRHGVLSVPGAASAWGVVSRHVGIASAGLVAGG